MLYVMSCHTELSFLAFSFSFGNLPHVRQCNSHQHESKKALLSLRYRINLLEFNYDWPINVPKYLDLFYGFSSYQWCARHGPGERRKQARHYLTIHFGLFISF